MEKKYTIAVVDDEKVILQMLEKFLTRNKDYEIMTFSDSEEGLDFVKNNNVDLVLLDIMMPKVDGMEFLEEIKAVKKDIKVIMMTAFSTLDRVLESHKIGAEGYLMKPFESLKVLGEKVQEVLEV